LNRAAGPRDDARGERAGRVRARGGGRPAQPLQTEEQQRCRAAHGLAQREEVSGEADAPSRCVDRAELVRFAGAICSAAVEKAAHFVDDAAG